MREIKNSSQPAAKFYGAIVIILFIGLSFFGGFFFGVWQTVQNEYDVPIFSIADQASQYLSGDNVDTSLFWKVWDAVTEKHITPVEDRMVFYGALKGMVASLHDPYSVFWDPEETKDFTQELEGSFEGIGAEIGIKRNQLTVIAPLPNSPADQAGLRAQDKILKIDGVDTTGITLDYAISLIRGEKDSSVVLTVQSEDAAEPREVKIVRDTIEVESVTWKMLDNDIAYMAITHFNENTDSLFAKYAKEIILREPAGLIIDLRNNPGGYLNSAVNVAGEFIEKKVIVIEDFGDRQKEYNSSGRAQLQGVKTVVLVNGGSASAAEIVAGAFQDYNIATIVGESTYGKGSVQDFEEFDDGSSLKLTVAHWLTPQGRSIEDNGITPDVEVSLTEEDYDADRDPQLDSAKALLIE